MEIWLWYPADGESGFWLDEFGGFYNANPMAGDSLRPLAIFSHGGCGHPLQSLYLYQHLVSWGFIVLCTQHPGSVWGNPDCLDADVLTDTWYNRPGDVQYTLDSVYSLSLAEPGRWGNIDTSHILMSGHSFGARTSYAVGNRFEWADCILAFSGDYTEVRGADMYCMDDIRGIDVPIMIMGGTLDYGLEETHFHEVFDTLDAPKFGVLLNRGGHLAYGDECNTELDPLCDDGVLLPQEIGHEIILQYSMSFIFKYLLDDGCWEEYLYEDYDTLADILYDTETVVKEEPHLNDTKLDFEIHPNPFRDIFFISAYEKGTVEIFDLSGRHVYGRDISGNGNSFQIDMEGQDTGIYFIRMRNDNYEKVLPLIKMD